MNWRDIPEFEKRYQVSGSGCVRNARTGRLLKPRQDSDGYQLVTLWKGSPTTKHDKKVHRVVAEAFLENPDGKPQVNHLNGVRSDNRTVNLEWATCSENHRHAFAQLGRKAGNERPVVALKTGCRLLFESVLEAARSGFNRRGIHKCLSGEYAQHKGFQWRYL